MELIGLFAQIFAYFLPYVACAALGAFLEYKFGNKVSAAVKADVAALKADVTALKAKVP